MASSLLLEGKGFEIQAMNVPTPPPPPICKRPQGRVVQNWVEVTQGKCEI